MSFVRSFAPAGLRSRSRTLPLPPSLDPEGAVVARRRWRDARMKSLDGILKLYQPEVISSEIAGANNGCATTGILTNLNEQRSEETSTPDGIEDLIGQRKRDDPLEGLQNNVFAHLMSDPARYCGLLRNRLPRSFLIRFEYRRVPQEEEGTQEQETESRTPIVRLNQDPEIDKAALPLRGRSKKDKSRPMRPPTGFVLPISLLRSTLPADDAAQIRKTSTKPLYVTAQELSVQLATADSTKFTSNALLTDAATDSGRRMVDRLGSSANSGMGLQTTLHWRRDMPELVLKLLRAGVIEEIRKVATAEGGVGCGQKLLATEQECSPSEALPHIVTCPLGPDGSLLHSIPDVGIVISLKERFWSQTIINSLTTLENVKETENIRKAVIRLLRKVDDRNIEAEEDDTRQTGKYSTSQTGNGENEGYKSILGPYPDNLPLTLYPYPPRLAEWMNRGPVWGHDSDYRAVKVPVVSSLDLVGDDGNNQMREVIIGAILLHTSENIEEDEVDWVVIRDTPETVELRKRLMILDTYLAKSI